MFYEPISLHFLHSVCLCLCRSWSVQLCYIWSTSERVPQPPKSELGVNCTTKPTELGWHRKLFLATGSKGELIFPAKPCHSQTFLTLGQSGCQLHSEWLVVCLCIHDRERQTASQLQFYMKHHWVNRFYECMIPHVSLQKEKKEKRGKDWHQAFLHTG